MSTLRESEPKSAKFDGDEAKVTYLLCEIKEAEHNIRQLREALRQKENSSQTFLSDLNEMDQKKDDHLKEVKKLHQRIESIDTSNYSDTIEELRAKLELLKALEKEESNLQSVYGKHADLPSVLDLEKKVSSVNEGHHDLINLSHYLTDSSHKLDLAKKELAAKLRAILSLKQEYDDVPAQTELIQYEHRFSELYAQIQKKHRQTRKYYDTYNALLEIKELMLKETSLLNSIDSQFQDAMSSVTGRSKLMDSMEFIVKGTKQKLEKVHLTLLAEQRICDSLKETHATAFAEQHHFYSLLKAFQEECKRNDILRGLASI